MYCAILSVWTWSLFQFVFVTTSVKELPKLEDKNELERETLPEDAAANCHQSNSRNKESSVEITEIGGEAQTKLQAVVDTKKEIRQKSRKCIRNFSFDHFCFYNESWSLVLGIIFQDGPFLVMRLLIMIHLGFIEGNVLFFTSKNILIISLIIYRIRVIYKIEKNEWIEHMNKYHQKINSK